MLKEFGASGMKFSSVGLGSWMMEKNPEDSVKALREGLENGANHIDTAEMYGEGRAEEIVGQAVESQRKSVFIVSKVLPSNATYQGTVQACERSLRRLKTDYLDAYLLHWREKNTPITETFRAFEFLKKQGKIRAWGVSNFSVSDMEESQRLMGKGAIACNQVLYHMNERAIEFDLMPWCGENKVSMVGYSPFGQGAVPKHEVLDRIADEREVTPAQVILAFLTRDPNAIAIPKSSNFKRVKENVQAMALKLSAQEIDKLNEAFPARKRKSLPMI